MAGGGEGREGDWECSGCSNRNYAFRSFCNRCKQPRLLVDTKTPHDSKWLPRVGDWICTGCTNNNYASREKCKKCGQPKEVAAMPAFAVPGASLKTHPHYLARVQGGHENLGLFGNGSFQQSLPLSNNWLPGASDRYGNQSASTLPLGDNPLGNSGVSYANQALVPKGWRNGDWVCTCGFHNYSSRAQCKKCNASMPPALGTKRLASDDLSQDWESKRLNAGPHVQAVGFQPVNQTLGLQQAIPALGHMASSAFTQTTSAYSSYLNGSSAAAPSLQSNQLLPQPQLVSMPMPTLPGKGAMQWREGDWMCTNCKNHNYASRSICNKCKTQKEGVVQPVTGS